jgi:hypothetical protein
MIPNTRSSANPKTHQKREIRRGENSAFSTTRNILFAATPPRLIHLHETVSVFLCSKSTNCNLSKAVQARNDPFRVPVVRHGLLLVVIEMLWRRV